MEWKKNKDDAKSTSDIYIFHLFKHVMENRLLINEKNEEDNIQLYQQKNKKADIKFFDVFENEEEEEK